jgi:hypothetical protein
MIEYLWDVSIAENIAVIWREGDFVPNLNAKLWGKGGSYKPDVLL